MRDVGLRKAAKHRGVEHDALRLGVDRDVHHVLHGLTRRRVLERAREHRPDAPHHRRAHVAVERAHERPRRALRRLRHVDVRIGPVAGDDGGVLHHRRRQLRVEVEADGDRQARRDGADASQQLAFTVVHVLGHHRAVQGEERGVAADADAADDGVAHVLVRAALDVAGRMRVGGERDDDLRAHPLRDVQEAAELRVGVLELGDGGLAAQRPK